MDSSTIQNAPQFHLARLYLNSNKNTIHGAKVMNPTLGSTSLVCGPLVQEALGHHQPMPPKQELFFARSVLHGLNDWIIQRRRQEEERLRYTGISTLPQGTTTIAEWEQWAIMFVYQGMADEANLYLQQGASLVGIEHNADTSDLGQSSRGAMAIFEF